MHHRFINTWGLQWFFNTARVIPIASYRDRPDILEAALEEVNASLSRGEAVVIFPEGRLCSDGILAPFRSGLDRILDKQPVPVLPMALKGLWGSFFSMKGGEFKGWIGRLRTPVELVFGEPIFERLERDQFRAKVLALSEGDDTASAADTSSTGP